MKRFIGIAGVMLLACGGITEQIIEGVTGEEITFSEDGFESTLPNDGKVSIQWAGAAQHPLELIFPPPPESELEISGTVTFPEQPDSLFVIYQSTAERDVLATQYRQVMEGMGMTVEEKSETDTTLALKAEQDGLTYIVAIETTPDGTTTVTLGQGSEEALEDGMNANPM